MNNTILFFSGAAALLTSPTIYMPNPLNERVLGASIGAGTIVVTGFWNNAGIPTEVTLATLTSSGVTHLTNLGSLYPYVKMQITVYTSGTLTAWMNYNDPRPQHQVPRFQDISSEAA